ncbi:MAG: globin family protein [Verrucomicrobiota bacterium]
MSVTPRQIELVQTTWEKVVPIADTAADLFYGQLFTIAPQVKPMFPEDMTEQKKKLMAMITVAVRGLKNVEALVPALHKLGAGHVGYGVKDEHYAIVGSALLWTLEKGLGDAWTDEVKDAWIAVYTLLADTMKQGAAAAA